MRRPPEAAQRRAAGVAAVSLAAALRAQPCGAQAGAEGEDCPADASLWDCVAWCERLAPASQATLSGTPCAHLEESRRSSPGAGPSCVCYDESFERVLRECRSLCPAPEAVIEEDEEACAAGDTACAARASRIAAVTQRYLLYDVKMGEGFNLQREVFPRAGWVVARLNSDVLQRCGGAFGPGHCAEWALVLPPWCRVAHWGSPATPVPWRAFFDLEALRSAKVKVLEFDEYAAEVGGALVDLAVSFTEDRIPRHQRYGQKGAFYGWTRQREACRTLAASSWDATQSRWTVEYAGQCDGGIRALEHRCGALSGTWPQDVADMVAAASRTAASVLVKRFDSVSPPRSEELDELGLREAMLFSSAIRRAGEDFIKDELHGGPFLAVHCRRTDFLRARAATTPDAESAAHQVDEVLQDLARREGGRWRVFVATDSPEELRRAMASHVKASVHFSGDGSQVRRFEHPGQRAAVEMWIAARADFFLGTSESRFTAHIQLERVWLGKAPESSRRELCKTWRGAGAAPCLAPVQRLDARQGNMRPRHGEL